MLFFAALLSIISLRLGDGTQVTDPNAAMEYLTMFNYMAPFDAKSGQLRTENSLIEGLKRFQRFVNISVTGKFDEDTMEIMSLPRCGNPDFVGTGQDARRRRRYAPQGSRWPKKALTYYIERFSSDLSQTNQARIIQSAFDIWADQTSLTFTRKGTSRGADIIILFARGNHGDGNPFDGSGGTLAHAYFPQFGGDAHFDDSERFTMNTYSGTNLFQVAAHEFGHSLGLAHSDVSDSLMAPFYRGYIRNYKLHRDDIEGIQHLYGRKTVSGPATPAYQPTRLPSECSGELDVMTRTADGNTYGFKGNQYWLITDSGAATGYPKPISGGWPGLPNNLDAGFFWERSGKTYFFKGSKYWRYANREPDVDYPKPVSNWRGAPANMDAVFVWSGNGRIYFVKGGQYYRYNPATYTVDPGYPAPLSNWKGLPASIQTAMQWKNGKTYFFSGSQYWRFNDKAFDIEAGYPRLTAIWWIGCSNTAALQGAGITAVAPTGNSVPAGSRVDGNTPNVVLDPNNSAVSNFPKLLPILISSLITLVLCML